MRADEVGTVLDTSKYQVFLLSHPSHFLVATHSWFVVNKKGEVSRWAIGLHRLKSDSRWGTINKNALPPFAGVPLVPGFSAFCWTPKILGYIEGGEDSLARNMIRCIEDSPIAYPYVHRYLPTGPNCNTYVQWILDQFPQSTLRLPWNAFGMHYAGK